MDLIDRGYLSKMLMYEGKYEMSSADDFNKAMEAVKDAPSIDAEVVHRAKWIYHKSSDVTLNFECSECHNCMFNVTNYCCNCGAKMDEI